jgi:hypothetical protein
MKYIIGHFCDHGDDFKIISFDTAEEVREYINKEELGPEDYYLFKGEMLKSIFHKTFDLKNLK